MLVTEYTDCSTCAVDSDTGYPYKTCAKCNTQLCAWCPNVCLTDNDDNKKICQDHSSTWTGSMDDCP